MFRFAALYLALIFSLTSISKCKAESPTPIWRKQYSRNFDNQPALRADSKVLYAGNTDGNLTAVNPKTGNVWWTFKSQTGINSGTLDSSNLRLFTVTGPNILCLFAHTGTQLWNFKANDTVVPKPTLSHNEQVLFVPSHDGYLYALWSLTGKMKWKYFMRTPTDSQAALSADGQIVYVGTSYSFDAVYTSNGTRAWTYPLHSFMNSRAALSKDGNTLYFGDNNGTMHSLCAKTGTPRWERGGLGSIWSSPALNKDETLVFAGSWADAVYAFETRTGAVAWQFKPQSAVLVSPVLSNDMNTVYIGSWDGNLYALRQDCGALEWAFPSGGTPQTVKLSNPAFASDSDSNVFETIYFGSGKSLYALNVSATGTARLIAHPVLNSM